MQDEKQDKSKRKGGDDAAPNPARRQFLKGLTTGAVAIGAVSQSGCAPAIPPLKTRGATNAARRKNGA